MDIFGIGYVDIFWFKYIGGTIAVIFILSLYHKKH